MKELAIRLSDEEKKDTNPYLGEGAAVSLNEKENEKENEIKFDIFDKSDNTYNPSSPIPPGTYILNVAYPDAAYPDYYPKEQLTVILSSKGGIKVSGESGKVVLNTDVADKNIIVVKMKRVPKYLLKGRIRSNTGDILPEVIIDLLHIDYLHNPKAQIHRTEELKLGSNGEFKLPEERKVPHGEEDFVFRFSSENHFPVEIKMHIVSDIEHELVIELKSARDCLIIIGAGHGINTDNRDPSGMWTVKENFYFRAFVFIKKYGNKKPGEPANINKSKKVLGHNPIYYTEAEGTPLFARQLYDLFKAVKVIDDKKKIINICPNIHTTRNIEDYTVQDMDKHVKNQIVTEDINKSPIESPIDWRLSVLWYIAANFQVEGGDFEFKPNDPSCGGISCIYRNHTSEKYSFGPNYIMRMPGKQVPCHENRNDFPHSEIVADYATYLTLTKGNSDPSKAILIEFHTNAVGKKQAPSTIRETIIFYRKKRIAKYFEEDSNEEDKLYDEHFAQTVAANVKETFHMSPEFQKRTTKLVWQKKAEEPCPKKRPPGGSNVFHALCPALTIETAYHTTGKDLKLILDEDFQSNVALGIFRGIRDYYYPRLRGVLESSGDKAQGSEVIYITKAITDENTNEKKCEAPKDLSGIVNSTVTDKDGKFFVNLENGVKYCFWIKKGEAFLPLNPNEKVLFRNEPKITVPSKEGEDVVVNVPKPIVFMKPD
jgi:hypothetical protein